MAQKPPPGAAPPIRIADLKAKPSPEAPPPAEEKPTAGYPAIEAELESETLESLVGGLHGSYKKLESLKTGGDLKTKSRATQALAAYERTAELFEYLFEIKKNLEAEAAEENKT